MTSTIKTELDKLLKEFADDLASPHTFNTFARPRLNRWYYSPVIEVYLTTGWYLAPEGTSEWVINISNIKTIEKYQRQGAFKYFLKCIEQLAKTYKGRVRVENVHSLRLRPYLIQRGYVAAKHDAITFWEYRDYGQQKKV